MAKSTTTRKSATPALGAVAAACVRSTVEPANDAAAVIVSPFALLGQRAAIDESGRRVIAAELGALLINADLDAWNAARGVFIVGAADEGYTDPGKLWERTIAFGQDVCDAKGVPLIKEKPKATSKAAVTKAAQRSERDDKIEELIKAHKPAELKAMVAKAATEGGDYRLIAHAADKAEKAANTKARDDAKDKVAAIKSRIDAAFKRLKDANNVAALEKLAAAAEKMSPAPKVEAAKV